MRKYTAKYTVDHAENIGELSVEIDGKTISFDLSDYDDDYQYLKDVFFSVLMDESVESVIIVLPDCEVTM